MQTVTVPHARSLEAGTEAWPFYIVCDVSSSMWDEAVYRDAWGAGGSPHRIITESLSLLIDEIYDDDEAQAHSHIGVVTFADVATVHLPLRHVRDNPVIRPLPKGSWTDYVGVWKLLAQVLPEDVARLRTAGFFVRRPTVFFLSDGQPGNSQVLQRTDEWKVHQDRLRSAMRDDAPRIVSIGLGGAVERVVLDVHSTDPHGAACIAERGSFISDLVKPVVRQMTRSIRTSTRKGAFDFQVPPGMVDLCGRSSHP
jgi:uncharacterized protein YegL